MSDTTITGATASSNGLFGGLGAGGAGALGKEEFLALLTAQLRNQNPLEPMQNEAFVAQLAQFSSLEQMQNVNSNLGASLLLTQSVNNSLATTLIGREVEGRGDGISLEEGGKANLTFRLSADADVKIEVKDSSGKVVATLTPGQLKSGEQTVTWDGKDSEGKAAPAADYTFKVTAKDAKGGAVATENLFRGRVTGIKFENGGTYLLIGSRRVSLSEITQILEAK